MAAALLQRKAALATLLGAPEPTSRLQISEYIVGDGPAMFDQVCRMGLEAARWAQQVGLVLIVRRHAERDLPLKTS